jgi:hypothetical protein
MHRSWALGRCGIKGGRAARGGGISALGPRRGPAFPRFPNVGQASWGYLSTLFIVVSNLAVYCMRTTKQLIMSYLASIDMI